MCGIAGVWDPLLARELPRVAQAMSDALASRGPDGDGVWSDASVGIAFGHRRLAIQDLSPNGAQPMISASGRYVITYNGEVYNFRALAHELGARGHRFRGGSDTEVMLAAFEEYGLYGALERFVGMFAFGLWDTHTRELHLVRDRLGIKPLYVGPTAGGIAFGSELTALEQVPGFDPVIDRDVLVGYFRYACVPSTHCIFAGCEKVPPGSVLTFRAPKEQSQLTTYWSAAEVVGRALEDPLRTGDAEAERMLDELLRRAVLDRKVADVPVGVFLSGGIDSSTVCALLSAQSTEPIRTFSIGFDERAYDEAKDARAIAEHLGTRHTELRVTPREAMDAIGDLGQVFTEPFADSSQLPTLLLCRLARRDVTVALSGDGGDEVFGGYNRHVWGPRISWAIGAVPHRYRDALARMLTRRSPRQWDEFADRWSGVLPFLRLRTPGDKAHKLARVIAADDLDDLYERLGSIWSAPRELVLSGHERWFPIPRIRGASVAEQMMLRDLAGYLHDDILPKVDRASMSVGLEVRVPLLDHRVVELAWRIPQRLKIKNGESKHILRSILARHVPASYFTRPKMGFGVPIDAWLRGPLRDWAEALLDRKRIAREGYLDPNVAGACWEEHLAGRSVRQHQLWCVLMFQLWHEAWRERRLRPRRPTHVAPLREPAG